MIGFLALMAAAGCGGGDGVGVSGVVTFQGQPVEDGMIQFLANDPAAEGRSAGAPIVDGKYAIARNGGPPPGSYRVEVTAYQEVREQTAEELGGAMFGRDPSELGIAPEAIMVRENVIPEQYNTKSTLSVTIPSQRGFQYDVEIP
jgi:hypothetical protein